MIVVTIEGPQGSGKSRLAREILNDMAQLGLSAALLDSEKDKLVCHRRHPDAVIVCKQGEPDCPGIIR